MLYFFLFSPARSYIFGANIDIFPKSCKHFRLFFIKNGKNMPFSGQFLEKSTHFARNSVYTSGFAHD